MAYVTLKHISREKFPLAFDENHLQLLFPTGAITKDFMPQQKWLNQQVLQEIIFLMNNLAQIFYGHGFHLQ